MLMTRFLARLMLMSIILCLIAGVAAMRLGAVMRGMNLAFTDTDSDLRLLDLNHDRMILLSPSNVNVDTDIAWSPDGQFIAYVASPDYVVLPNLYVVNIGGEIRQLVSAVRGGNPQLRWSPDGTQIAMNTVPVEVGTCVITIVDAQSGEQQHSINTGRCGEFHWSSDGRYYSYDTQVFRADTHEAIYDTAGSVPRWSPQGSTVLFERDEQAENRLYIAQPDGEDTRMLTNGREAMWLPDGRIAFTRSAAAVSDVVIGFWTIDADSENLTPITREYYGRWSPDMHWAASLILEEIVEPTVPLRQRAYLYLLNLDSGELSLIEQAEAQAGFAWRP